MADSEAVACRGRGRADRIANRPVLELATGKDTITSAPEIDPDGELASAEEAELFRHYGLSYGEQPSPAGLPETGVPETGVPETGVPETGVPETETQAGGPMAGQADDAMTRSEEQMRVGTAAEPAGRARLRKYVVTEQVQQTVPVSREEVRIEREPVTEANRDAAMSGRRSPRPSARSRCTRNGPWWRRRRCRWSGSG